MVDAWLLTVRTQLGPAAIPRFLTEAHLQHVLLMLQHAIVVKVQVSTALVSLCIKNIPYPILQAVPPD